MLYTYSVTPLKEDHFEERVKDIIDMQKQGVVLMPLFSMTLVPEGDPVWDKAGRMSRLFARYRDELEKEGLPSGILVQASLGHGYPITANPFRKYVNLTDGAEANVCCPDDERFLTHFENVLRTLAKERPKAIMLDDDFRLMMRPGKGCACEYHMAEFNRLSGTDMTREELYSHLRAHPKSDRLNRIYTETQKASLVKAAERFRAAIDEIDPSIQGINCTSGHICESVIYTNKIFAGRGNPTMVRVPNGIYAPISVRGFSDTMRQAAICSSKLKKNGIDIILAETDTIPFNRYAKSARYLHAHFAASCLEGLSGAKHWLTRTAAFEPGSGKAYRDILAKHKGMYERLFELSKEISFVGCSSAFIEASDVNFNEASYGSRSQDNYFVTDVLERMGIPFYFSDRTEKASFLEGDLVDNMTDEQIEAVLHGSVFCDSTAARSLVRRGYGDALGVDVLEWDLGPISAETFDDEGNQTCTKQKNSKKLVIKDGRTTALSYNFRKCDGGIIKLAPAVTVRDRGDGNISVVFCGSPHAPFNYGEGFAFLNETRKHQLIELLSRCGALPVYAPGDDELCLRAGYLKDGSLLTFITELGIDPIDMPVLYYEKQPRSITQIDPDGNESEIEFRSIGDNKYALDIKIEPMYPVVIIAKF